MQSSYGSKLFKRTYSYGAALRRYGKHNTFLYLKHSFSLDFIWTSLRRLATKEETKVKGGEAVLRVSMATPTPQPTNRYTLHSLKPDFNAATYAITTLAVPSVYVTRPRSIRFLLSSVTAR